MEKQQQQLLLSSSISWIAIVGYVIGSTVLILYLCTLQVTTTSQQHQQHQLYVEQQQRRQQQSLSSTSRSSAYVSPDDHNDRDRDDDDEQTYMLQCLDTVLRELPIGPGKRGRKPIYERGNGVWSHQLEAGTVGLRPFKKIRTYPPLQALILDNTTTSTTAATAPTHRGSKTATCSVWEIGAHTQAEESEILMPQYPACEYHAYEPVPVYYNQLDAKWTAYNARRSPGQPKMTTHNYGLSDRNYSFAVTPEQLQGIATYINDNEQVAAQGSGPNEPSSDNKNVQYAQIRTFASAMVDAGPDQPQYPTMLEINCEGCEWEMIPAMLQENFIQHVAIVVLGTHNYGTVGVGIRSMELCRMRYALSKTHTLIPGSRAFAWERWELKEEKKSSSR